jgi:hypothetical protein
MFKNVHIFDCLFSASEETGNLIGRLQGLVDPEIPSRSRWSRTPLQARILSATRKKPRDGSTYWSCRKLAAALGVSKDAVHRTWAEADLKPHRLERYMSSDDPDLHEKPPILSGST